MSTKFSVYFDTRFYVALSRAGEAEAIRTIDKLNTLSVRHVISDILVRELLTSRDRTDFDEALVSRLRQFKEGPFCTREDLKWDVLLLSGSDRVDAANLLRNIHDMMSEATSFSIMARRTMNDEQAVNVTKAAMPLLRQFGFPEDFDRDLTQVITGARNMFEAFGLPEIDFPSDPTPENLFDLSEQIKGLLDPDVVERSEEEARIQDSSTLSEDRPYRVAAGIASEKTKKRLSNTLRDTEHMTMFAVYREDIDVLQVDKVHERIIKRGKPPHRLAELGLAERCFSSDSLSETVQKVRKLKEIYGFERDSEG